MTASALLKTGTAVAATAVIGSAATDPASPWYRNLDKPRWQPPSWGFPLVWTPLYGLLAYAGARVLDRADGAYRGRFVRAYATNLALNAGWTVLFFRGRNTRVALAEIVALGVSNVDLLRRAWPTDRVAAAALAPYVLWTGFATALNASIAARNPHT